MKTQKRPTRKQHNRMKDLEEKIPPREYMKMLNKLELRDVYLSEIKSRLFSKDLSPKTAIKLSETFDIEQINDDEAIIKVGYTLKAKSGRKNVLSINASYLVVFSTKETLSREFFELYSRYNLPLQTYPYFRELTNSIVSRMSLPPLVLGLRKPALASND